MKKLVFLIIALFIGFTGFSEENSDKKKKKEKSAEECILKGQILDKSTGNPLTGVTVVLENGKETFTDFNGYFDFKNIEPGKHHINISYISYENKTFENIVLNKEDKKTLKIQLNSVRN